MFHHDSRDYKVAKSAAAKKGREKMDAIIAKSSPSAEAVIQRIEETLITDRIAKTSVIRLHTDDEGEQNLAVGGELLPIHPYGWGQILDAAGIQKDFRDHLTKEAGGELWGKELLAHNVNTIFAHRGSERKLIRTEGKHGPVKGFRSDKFRRLDSRPLLDAFIGACQDYGLQPYEGVASDTKVRVRAVLPQVFEPVPDEVMLFGAEFGNSDFGDGGMVVNLWTMRVWCTNLAITEKCLRQVHLGAKLPDDLRLSAATYELDAKTMASAVRDITGDAISPDRVNRMVDAIADASEEEIDSRDGIDKILGRAVSKTEGARIKGIFESPDVQNLPAGPSIWRLSNAVSWFAQSKDLSADRKIELQNLAGVIAVGDTKNVKEA